jgi:hypothetical protein
MIVDRGGHVLELAYYEALITAPVNLNSIQLHLDFNWEKLDAMLAKYGAQLRYTCSSPEGRYVITSESVPIDQIMAEFELLDVRDYFTEARRRRLAELDAADAHRIATNPKGMT